MLLDPSASENRTPLGPAQTDSKKMPPVRLTSPIIVGVYGVALLVTAGQVLHAAPELYSHHLCFALVSIGILGSLPQHVRWALSLAFAQIASLGLVGAFMLWEFGDLPYLFAAKLILVTAGTVVLAAQAGSGLAAPLSWVCRVPTKIG